MSALQKSFVVAFSLLLCGLILSPIREHGRTPPKDSFPLSYYPMFTQSRGQYYNVRHPMVTDARGRQYELPYYYAGSGGFNQTRRQISRTVREGSTPQLCNFIAGNLAARPFPTEAPIEYISIVTSTYDLDAYYFGERKLLRRVSHLSARLLPPSDESH